MRVALINPPDPSSADGFRLTAPLGLGYLAAYARQSGFHVDIFDISRRFDNQVVNELGLSNYSVVGFTTYSDTFLNTIELIRLVQRRAPECKIILGGYHATSMDVAVIRDFPFIDVVFRKDSEQSFVDYLISLDNRGSLDAIPGITFRDGAGRVVRNPDRAVLMPVDLLPFPAIDVINAPPYLRVISTQEKAYVEALPMVSSRGCPKKCSFCSIIRLNATWRARSVESMMDEIKYRMSAVPYGHIIFQDANFLVNVTRSVHFARQLKASYPKVTWSGTATADLILRHREVLPELGELNCSYLEVGIESGNDNSLKRFNKGTTVAMNEEVISLLRRSAIDLAFDFIMFDPDMTFDDLIDNYRFLQRNDLLGYWPSSYLFQELKLYPETPFREDMERRRGQAYEPHVVPKTSFSCERVEKVALAMHLFLHAYQADIDVEIKDLTRAAEEVLYGKMHRRNLSDSSVRRVQEAYAQSLRLKHYAARFFEYLLSNAEWAFAIGKRRGRSDVYDLYEVARELRRSNRMRREMEEASLSV